MINITDNAKKQFLRLLDEKKNASFFVRVGVKGGGCSGLSYDVKLDNQTADGDKVFCEDPFKIVCDAKSLLYLSGIQIDFSTALVGGGFDYAVYINSGTPYHGSLSNATTEEAKSWGKIKDDANAITLHGDASILFPLIISSLD